MRDEDQRNLCEKWELPVSYHIEFSMIDLEVSIISSFLLTIFIYKYRYIECSLVLDQMSIRQQGEWLYKKTFVLNLAEVSTSSKNV